MLSNATANNVIGFGMNSYCEAAGKQANQISCPSKIGYFSKLNFTNESIVLAQAGFRFSVLVTANSDVYVLGHNRFGNLGTGLPDNSTPEKADQSNVASVITLLDGESHNLVW